VPFAIAFFAAALAGAQPGVAPQGEAVVEIAATGAVTREANLITFSIGIEESGTSDAETRRMAEDRVLRVTAAARAAGIAEGDIRATNIHLTSFAGMTPLLRDYYRHQAESHWSVRRMGPRYDAHAAEDVPPPFNATATAGIVIRLRDASRLDGLRRALSAANESEPDWPDFALTDQREADAEARRQALAMARADADAQAASRGMRVVRIARVSERVGPQLAEEMLRRFFFDRHSSGGSLPGPEITVRRPIAVTFVLVPR